MFSIRIIFFQILIVKIDAQKLSLSFLKYLYSRYSFSYSFNFSWLKHRESKFWTNLDFKWSKRGWVANGRDFEWDLKLVQMDTTYSVKNHLKSCRKCLGFEWSGFLMVGTIALAIATSQPFENVTI